MTDIEVALELTKIVLSNRQTAILFQEPDKLLDLFRKCLAVVREKQE